MLSQLGVFSVNLIPLVVLYAVVPSITMQEHAGNDKSCVWHASDFSDGELKDEMFCIRFGSVESEYCADDMLLLYLLL